jgi:hypothetical protein
MDLSKLSDADLQALSNNDLSKVSDEGLAHLSSQQTPFASYASKTSPANMPQERGLIQDAPGTASIVNAPIQAYTGASVPNPTSAAINAANTMSGGNLEKIPQIKESLDLAKKQDPASSLVGSTAGLVGQIGAGGALASAFSPVTGGAISGGVMGALQNPGENDSVSQRLKQLILGAITGAGAAAVGKKIAAARNVSNDISLVKDPVAREQQAEDLLKTAKTQYQQKTLDPLMAARNSAVSAAPEASVDVAKLSAATGEPELDAMVKMMNSGKMSAEELAQNRQAYANIPSYNKAGVPTNAGAASNNASYLRSLEDPSVVSANKNISESMRPLNMLNEYAAKPSEALKYSPQSTQEAILAQLQQGSGVNVLDRAKQLKNAQDLIMPSLKDSLKYPLASAYTAGERAAVEIPAAADRAYSTAAKFVPGASPNLNELLKAVGRNAQALPKGASEVMKLKDALEKDNNGT